MQTLYKAEGRWKWWSQGFPPKTVYSIAFHQVKGERAAGSGVCGLVAQSCLNLCNPMDRSPPDSSVLGILQARILEWVAIPFSQGSSQPRDRTQVSHIAGRFFTVWATRKPAGSGTTQGRGCGEWQACLYTSQAGRKGESDWGNVGNEIRR